MTTGVPMSKSAEARLERSIAKASQDIGKILKGLFAKFPELTFEVDASNEEDVLITAEDDREWEAVYDDYEARHGETAAAGRYLMFATELVAIKMDLIRDPAAFGVVERMMTAVRGGRSAADADFEFADFYDYDKHWPEDEREPLYAARRAIYGPEWDPATWQCDEATREIMWTAKWIGRRYIDEDRNQSGQNDSRTR